MGSEEKFINITDDCVTYDPDLFVLSETHRPYMKGVLIPNGLITDRIQGLARDIVLHCASENMKTIHLVCILTGSYYFFSDLFKAIELYIMHNKIDLHVYVEHCRLQSYADDKSTGEVRIIGADCSAFVKNNNIVIVEDIVDTGRTMNKLLPHVESLEPKSVLVCSLLVKRTPLSSGYRPNFIGFEIPDHFVVGYGLDFNESFRTLPMIVDYDPQFFELNTVARAYIDRIVIGNGFINDRTSVLAQEIINNLVSQGIETVHFVCILTGACFFFTDLCKAIESYIASNDINLHIYIQYCRAKSYNNDESTGHVKLSDDWNFVKDANIVLVEDMIDTGQTMKKLIEHLKSFKPISLLSCVLLTRKIGEKMSYEPDFIGFQINNQNFLVGYGLDYNENFRSLKHICSLNEDGKKKFAITTKEGCD